MSVFGGYYDASYPPSLWETPAAPVAAARKAASDDAPTPVGAVLEAVPGTPGSYSPGVKAADRPVSLTDLRARTSVPVEPFPPGTWVPVGEKGRRAYWTGEDWTYGEAPPEQVRTVPTGTVERPAGADNRRSGA